MGPNMNQTNRYGDASYFASEEAKTCPECGGMLNWEGECPECPGTSSKQVTNMYGELSCEKCGEMFHPRADMDGTALDVECPNCRKEVTSLESAFDKFMDKIVIQERAEKRIDAPEENPMRQRAAKNQERPLGRTKIVSAKR